jgi:hypothetical protein
MGSYDPFGHFKHKLWPKEGMGIKFMGLQSHESPNFGTSETPTLGVPRQNDIWVLAMWPNIENTLRGKVVASPKFRLW